MAVTPVERGTNTIDNLLSEITQRRKIKTDEAPAFLYRILDEMKYHVDISVDSSKLLVYNNVKGNVGNKPYHHIKFENKLAFSTACKINSVAGAYGKYVMFSGIENTALRHISMKCIAYLKLYDPVTYKPSSVKFSPDVDRFYVSDYKFDYYLEEDAADTLRIKLVKDEEKFLKTYESFKIIFQLEGVKIKMRDVDELHEDETSLTSIKQIYFDYIVKPKVIYVM